jgi:single-strand DNA-binding protein
VVNLVVLEGRLSKPAASRLLPSGDRLVAFEVSVARDEGPAESVPVVWFEAPAAAATLDTGREVVVVGRVRRRFFQAGGGTASRTEVVADQVVPANQAKRANALLAVAARRLAGAARQ